MEIHIPYMLLFVLQSVFCWDDSNFTNENLRSEMISWGKFRHSTPHYPECWHRVKIQPWYWCDLTSNYSYILLKILVVKREKDHRFVELFWVLEWLLQPIALSKNLISKINITLKRYSWSKLSNLTLDDIISSQFCQHSIRTIFSNSTIGFYQNMLHSTQRHRFCCINKIKVWQICDRNFAIQNKKHRKL